MIKENIEGKYFIDQDKFNCPFCKNRAVKYLVLGVATFNEKVDKEFQAIFVKCCHCHKISMHLAKEKLVETKYNFVLLNQDSTNYRDHLDPSREQYFFDRDRGLLNYDFEFKEIYLKTEPKEIDESMIMHIPSSFFILQEEIPKKLRDLISEAENCITNNSLTGASACIRKTIYEFVLEKKLQGESYEEKIKSLKKKYPQLDENLVNILSHIQGMTSNQVHEASYEKFQSNDAKAYVELLKEIFDEVYVKPKQREQKHSAINARFTKLQQS